MALRSDGLVDLTPAPPLPPPPEPLSVDPDPDDPDAVAEQWVRREKKTNKNKKGETSVHNHMSPILKSLSRKLKKLKNKSL